MVLMSFGSKSLNNKSLKCVRPDNDFNKSVLL